MEKHNISPDRITKPIQLLGAWLVGLLSIDGAFLLAATKMDSWQAGALTIAAIVNVPIFLAALFSLQTKFRPELQEDSYYSTYLNNRTNEVMKIPPKDPQTEHLITKINGLEAELKSKTVMSEVDFGLDTLTYGINEALADIETIEKELVNVGVLYSKQFGSDKDDPIHRCVAFKVGLSRKVINEIMMFAKSLGFTHYSHIEEWEDISEDVLFGAYGTPVGKIN